MSSRVFGRVLSEVCQARRLGNYVCVCAGRVSRSLNAFLFCIILHWVDVAHVGGARVYEISI